MEPSHRAFNPVTLRRVVVMLASLCVALPVMAQASGSLAAAEVRIGIERLAKLHYELRVGNDTVRTRKQLQRERDQLQAALGALRAQKVLTPAQRSRVAALSEGVMQYADRAATLGDDGSEMYRDSEALVARISFVSVALAAEDGQRSVLLDLVTRAAATAQRVGKINFARNAGLVQSGLQVDAQQSLIEFRSALLAIGEQGLDENTRGELVLAQHQWLLLRAALTDSGQLRDRRHLGDLATTSDRITESLLALARRAVRQSPG